MTREWKLLGAKTRRDASRASRRAPAHSRALHFTPPRAFQPSTQALITLNQSIRRKYKKRKALSKSPLLENNPQRRGVVMQVFTAKPKKPNSAKRKVARVKLTTGKVTQAYVPGEGHNLQEHAVVLVRGGRAQDLPGVRYKLVRGTMDFSGVPGRTRARSRYGAKKPKKT
ncbi:hypothetical protein K488DRAFT_80317 [Vararia minispora EC-137]|uniref:Uncharacterized protein n=1 Tax=Vararia minispora EC-137 TaxID=1314806 RepID=A0ACB8QBW7_9AGAM|nr:hypothetical protein K488DRAFT_80317 [Vararia minispora EC-137]